MSSVATVISYCTNDYRFISKCIEEARRFSRQIVIPVCDHFFDGTPERQDLLRHTYADHPDCLFVEFAYTPDRIYSEYHSIPPGDPDWAIFWAATSRYVGFHYVDPAIDSVLFLDSDEVVEAPQFLSWIESGGFAPYEAVRLGSYLYALKPTLRGEHAVNLSLLVRRKSFAPLTLFNPLERIGAYMSHEGPKREEVVGLDGRPFVHHYSWVRTKEECLWKTRTWSHRHDEDWPVLIDDAFSGKTTRLFGSHQEFCEIPVPYFDPLQVSLPAGKPPTARAIQINRGDLIRKEMEHALL